MQEQPIVIKNMQGEVIARYAFRPKKCIFFLLFVQKNVFLHSIIIKKNVVNNNGTSNIQ